MQGNQIADQMAGGAGLGLIMIGAALLVSFAPVIMALIGNRFWPAIIALALTFSAGVTMVAVTSILGQILAVLIWIGALLVGTAAYVAGEVGAAIRKSAPRPVKAQRPPPPPGQ